MNQKQLIFISFLMFAFSTMANAQKMELGKVTLAELEEKSHPKDPSAPAAILFKKGISKFDYTQSDGFTMITTVKTKIKIYKKEGFDWANQKVWYRLQSNVKENVFFSDAVTYNLVDGKIVKTKLKNEGEFDEKLTRYIGEKKITMPAVKEGSIIEFEYEIKSPVIGKIRDWDFQATIPVNYSEFKTFIPEYFIYRVNQKGYLFPKASVEKLERSIMYTYREQAKPGDITIGGGSQENLKFSETKTTYIAENLPALRDENFVNNIENYMATISHELSMVKYPNVPLKNYSTDWESVTKTIYDNDDFGIELNKTGYFENALKTLTEGLKTQPEIVAAILNYVKTNVKWDNYYGYSCNDGVKNAYKTKTGNVAEINLMLVAMLRYAGINANPVLISTRSNGISFFPNRTAFNYVIAAIENPNGVTLLDATEKFSQPDILPLRDLNWIGRLIRKDGTSKEIELIPKKPSKEIIFMNGTINPEGFVTGKIRKQYTDYEALQFRQQYVSVNQEIYQENQESKHHIEISEYQRDNDQDIAKPVVENFSFKSTNEVENINGKIYISPMLFLRMKENPFKQEVREYPVDFGYPTQSKYNLTLEIPDGYKIQTLPAAANIITADEFGAFKYIIGSTGNKIQITITSDINTAILPADYYAVLKDYFQKMYDKENEKIVLIKA
ncbi:hypothetical protein FNO01nite_23580 [Flavobacterium noncentrifugens]|uniref:Transglutaminase-like superfamily protein n=1 Tax=Flavobacterium noncentrifugens TaxID=1128970 RepID=A0A1G9B2R7_9FLAO|nr:DUF3857 domain-containing protein [Flavobacterium noncentrifugens]GEP51686.1 hypothetical protein FNO01nite_23580 [Flavobacterium noncentrifugens]SDK33859.1 Transglutaminase-like superfamily protein [Flavobacterium noncentrifugens]